MLETDFIVELLWVLVFSAQLIISMSIFENWSGAGVHHKISAYTVLACIKEALSLS
jgi:hypothetical protein